MAYRLSTRISSPSRYDDAGRAAVERAERRVIDVLRIAFTFPRARRSERGALIVTTNPPFSEWTTVFPNLRLCKALLDRVTDRAHIIDTGTDSFPFRGRWKGGRRLTQRGGLCARAIKPLGS